MRISDWSSDVCSSDLCGAPISQEMAEMATEPTFDAQTDDLMIDDLGTLHRKALTILKRIRDGAIDPETGAKKRPTFPISKAAATVGRTASAIREAERDGRLPGRGRTGPGHRPLGRPHG